ncbi:hypothetical protein [Paenibacillus wulumuqiensis]|uniref:hypothetical protein n=1 Tax=Paenibacillus wulumuqiensis TaxID=1567107 RepID=UPI000619CBBF|nr:hypothetical protein [Paenibacillus wulumuqiensis]
MLSLAYAVGIGVTALILIVQFAMHGRSAPVLGAKSYTLSVSLVNHTDPVENLLKTLEDNEIYIVKLYSETNAPTQSNSDIPDTHIQSEIQLKMEIKFPASMRTSDVMLILQSLPDVRRINLE